MVGDETPSGDSPPSEGHGESSAGEAGPAARQAASSRRGRLWVAVLLIVVLALTLQVTGALAGGTWVPYAIPSEGMSPTLQPGDRVFVNKSVEREALPRAAVIVFTPPSSLPDHQIRTVVKRIIGLPGESITIKNDRIHINGNLLDEPWMGAGVPTIAAPDGVGYEHTCTDADPCVVPSNQYWVMGDNRENSQDSRHFGPIGQRTVVGRVEWVYWPLLHVRPV